MRSGYQKTMLIYHRFEVFLLLSSWALSVNFQLTTRKPVKAAERALRVAPPKEGRKVKKRGARFASEGD